MNLNINPISKANYRHDLRTRKNNSTNGLNENRQINDMPNYYYPAFKENPGTVQQLRQEIARDLYNLVDTNAINPTTSKALLQLQKKLQKILTKCETLITEDQSLDGVNTKVFLESKLSNLQNMLPSLLHSDAKIFMNQLSKDIIEDPNFHNRAPQEFDTLITEIEKFLQYNVYKDDMNETMSLLKAIPTYKEMDFDSLYQLYKDATDCDMYSELVSITDNNKYTVLKNVLKDRFPTEFRQALDNEKNATNKLSILDIIDFLHIFH